MQVRSFILLLKGIKTITIMKNKVSVTKGYAAEFKSELQSSGRIFGGTYIKKNGEVTSFNGRMGVAKFTKGGKSSIKESNWLIWDNNRKRYMQIIPDQLVSVSAFGNEYEFINE